MYRRELQIWTSAWLLLAALLIAAMLGSAMRAAPAGGTMPTAIDAPAHAERARTRPLPTLRRPIAEPALRHPGTAVVLLLLMPERGGLTALAR